MRGTGLAVIAEIFSRAANFIFFILLTWHLGDVEASTYSVGFVYTSFLIYFSLGGLDQLLNREVSHDQRQGAVVLGSFLFARLIASLLCYVGLIFWIVQFSAYTPHTSAVVLMLGATLMPESLINLFQSYLIARDRVGTITILSAITGGLKLGIGALVVLLGGDALALATVVLGTSLTSALLYLLIIGTQFEWPRISFERSFWITQGRAELPLFLLAIMATVESSFDALLLSSGGNNDVRVLGSYSAAAMVLSVLILLPQTYRQIILALMAGYYNSLRQRAFDIYLQSKRLLLIISLLASLSITLIADQIIAILYKEQFAAAVPILQILVWSFVFTTLLVPSGRLMLVAGRQRDSVPIQFASMVVNVVLNVLLQPGLGPQGAALARVASTGITCVLSLIYVQRHIYRWNIWPILLGPLGASLALLLVVLGLRWLGLHWLLALASGWAVFGLVLYVLGGISNAELRRLIDLVRQGTAQIQVIVRGS